MKDFIVHEKNCKGEKKPGKKERKAAAAAKRAEEAERERQRRAAEEARRARQRKPVVPQTKFIETVPDGPTNFLGLIVNQKHMHFEVKEIYEMPDVVSELEGVNAMELLDLQKEAKWDDGVLEKWHGWSGGQAFKQGSAMVAPLTSVLEYAETNETAAKDIKPKLRYVTKCLKNMPLEDAREVLCLLATHGGVCHVQKEIAVRSAFSACFGTISSDCDQNDPKNTTLRLLYELRESCIEDLYKAQYLNGAKTLNSHGLVGTFVCDFSVLFCFVGKSFFL